MLIEYKRIYDHDIDMSNAYTIFTDKMYPRGIKREDKRIKRWIKDVAPDMKLIEWFHENANKRWPEFKQKYKKELHDKYRTDPAFRDEIDNIIKKGKEKGKILILYSSKDERHNNARVFANFLMHIINNTKKHK